MARVAAVGLLCTLLVAGCVDNGAAGSDNDKHPVLYGGVSAGGARP